MSIFNSKNKAKTAEKQRLWDALSEFLRRNYRPEGDGIATASTDSMAGAAAGTAMGGSAAGAAAGLNASMQASAMMANCMPVAAKEEKSRRKLFGHAAKSAAREDACAYMDVEETADMDAEAPAECFAMMMEEAPAAEPAQYAKAEVSSQSVQMRKRTLQEAVAQVGETWQQSLLRMIDERGMSDPEVYKRANVDRKLFSKIRCSEDYIPKKKTIVALAIALRLNMDDTRDLLASAGLMLTNNSKADVIVSFCIENGIYDIFEVNALLFKFRQPILG